MSRPGQLHLPWPEGPLCCGCALKVHCGAAHSARACHPDPGLATRGGLNALHRLHPELDDHLAEVGGPGYESVIAQPVHRPAFPLIIPRIRPRRALRSELHGSYYAIGPDEAFAGRRAVLAADDLREILDIWGNQGLMLSLFGADELQEEIWLRREQVVAEIAAATYDFVLPPSFSAWSDRPPPDFIVAAKRSLEFFRLLQEAGVRTAPRLVWLSEHDAKRAARWCDANASVQLIALDLAIKQEREWRGQLNLLGYFDALTGRRLIYLIHGPAADSRREALFSIVGSRLHLTGSRAIARPPERGRGFAEFSEDELAAAERALVRAEVVAAQGKDHAAGTQGPLRRSPSQAAAAVRHELAA